MPAPIFTSEARTIEALQTEFILDLRRRATDLRGEQQRSRANLDRIVCGMQAQVLEETADFWAKVVLAHPTHGHPPGSISGSEEAMRSAIRDWWLRNAGAPPALPALPPITDLTDLVPLPPEALATAEEARDLGEAHPPTAAYDPAAGIWCTDEPTGRLTADGKVG